MYALLISTGFPSETGRRASSFAPRPDSGPERRSGAARRDCRTDSPPCLIESRSRLAGFISHRTPRPATASLTRTASPSTSPLLSAGRSLATIVSGRSRTTNFPFGPLPRKPVIWYDHDPECWQPLNGASPANIARSEL